MNKVILIGNLTKDPELMTTTSGIAVCKFGIAVSRKFKNEQGEYETDFFNIVVWRGQAENCGKYLKKGSKVGIVGSVQNRSYDAKDGSKRYVTEIMADDVEFLTAKSTNSKEAEDIDKKPDSKLEPVDNDSLPF